MMFSMGVGGVANLWKKGVRGAITKWFRHFLHTLIHLSRDENSYLNGRFKGDSFCRYFLCLVFKNIWQFPIVYYDICFWKSGSAPFPLPLWIWCCGGYFVNFLKGPYISLLQICIKPVLSSSENRDNNQTASSGNPASSTDVSELKMRLERIKRLAKSWEAVAVMSYCVLVT